MRAQQSKSQANPVRRAPVEPGWALAVVGLFVVVAAIGGVTL